jgi:hypothetical protein
MLNFTHIYSYYTYLLGDLPKNFVVYILKIGRRVLMNSTKIPPLCTTVLAVGSTSIIATLIQ